MTPTPTLNCLGRCLRKREVRVRKDNGLEQAMETVVREAAFILVNVWLGEGP